MQFLVFDVEETSQKSLKKYHALPLKRLLKGDAGSYSDGVFEIEFNKAQTPNGETNHFCFPLTSLPFFPPWPPLGPWPSRAAGVRTAGLQGCSKGLWRTFQCLV